MAYITKFKVDGGCRGNGSSYAKGAAAAVLVNRWGKCTKNSPRRTQGLRGERATNQRAELTALIIALDWAIEKCGKLTTAPKVKITIYSDSKYTIGCMTEWLPRWLSNGWMNAAGREVANRDLIEQASDLEDELERWNGKVRYRWIPREENEHADQACNDAMDAMDSDVD